MPRESKYKYLDYEKNPKNMTDSFKRLGRDTVRGMGLDPDMDYVAPVKKGLSDLGIDLGVGFRDYGRLYKQGLGMKPDTPFEGDRGAKQLREARDEMQRETRGMKSGGSVKSASSRADGCAIRGKTKGKFV
jgi:hypothetical protein